MMHSDDDGLEECCICDRRLKPMCETKHHEERCYCMDCYKEKYLLDKIRKLQERI